MQIIGPDMLLLGVEDPAEAAAFVHDYGLVRRSESPDRVVFEALDGTGLDIRRIDDPDLPPAVNDGPGLRETIYGVADQASLNAIAAELSKDRAVIRENAVVRSHDEDGYPIAFQLTKRHAIDSAPYRVNCPGSQPSRAANQIAAIDDEHPLAYTLSHFVLFTRDREKAERFYAGRLGFRTVDIFTNLGPFMRPAGTNEHHTLFLIQADRLGMQHFAFHFAGANEVMKAGWNMMNKGHVSDWGPGRHILGSNWFWYFESPFGCLMEMDADMDLHDDSWVPREMVADENTSQTLVLQFKPKHSPATEARKKAAQAGGATA